MATYLITAPDGKKYQVSGNGSKEDALAHLQAQLGGSAGHPSEASQPLPPILIEMAARERQGLDPRPPTGYSPQEIEMAMRARQGLNPEPPKFTPKGVEGYNPQTGNVDKLGSLGTFMASGTEGVPIVGPALDEAARATSAGVGSLVTGDPYAKTKAQVDNMVGVGRQENPNSRLAGNVAGGVATLGPIGGTEAGGYALGIKGASTAGRLFRAALSGAALSGGDTAVRGGSSEDILKNAALGAVFSPVANLLGEGLTTVGSKVAGVFNKAVPKAETLAELNAAKDAAYNASEQAGIIIKPQGIQDVIAKVKDDFVKFGFRPKNQPGAAEALAALEEVAGNNVTLKGMDSIRKAAQGGYVLGNKTNNALIQKAVQRIDEMIDSNNPAFMAGIDTPAGTAALKQARGLAHRAFKLETVQNLIKKGNQQADRNITDTRVKSVKSQLAKINDPFSSWGRGFSAAEKAAADKAARYTAGQRVLHGISGLNPFGGGKLSAMSHIGAAALGGFNPAQLALQGVGAGVGMGAGKLGESLANRSVRGFADLVARGGPAPVIKNSTQKAIEAQKQALIQILEAAGISLPMAQ